MTVHQIPIKIRILPIKKKMIMTKINIFRTITVASQVILLHQSS